MSLAELEKAVSELTPDEFSKFAAWFEERMADEWDKQIEHDAVAGKFDRMFKKADDDFKSGHCTEL